MPIYRVEAESLIDGSRATFWFDNQTAEIFETEPEGPRPEVTEAVFPKKSRKVSRLKIQLGLSCNYSCSYCSQKMVERPRAVSRKEAVEFAEKLKDKIDFSTVKRVELWGGEPLLYWPTLVLVTEVLKPMLNEDAYFSIITNGSLLTLEKNQWLDENGFAVAVSHDGPGQHVRGDDPLVDNKEAIVDLKNRLLPKGLFSFNATLNKQNPSRMAVFKFFDDLFPGEDVPIGELGFADAYHEDGVNDITFSPIEMRNVRRDAWVEFRLADYPTHRSSWPVSFCEAMDKDQGGLMTDRQKCGMDREDYLVVDLQGNVITCQNVSAVQTAPNGKSHKIGHIDQLEETELTTAISWTTREGCRKCPVVRLCRGSCMFLEGENFSASCEMSYSAMIPVFALWFETKTGYVPVSIEGHGLPAHRSDVWCSTDLPPERRKEQKIAFFKK